MWGQPEAAGAGFAAGGGGGGGYAAGATDQTTPSVSDNQGKARRSQNIVPVTVKQLLQCREDSLKVEGLEVNVITIVGLVRTVETTTTKLSMYIDDQTGTIECVSYIGTDGDPSNDPTVLCEGTYGRIVGALRKDSKGARYLIIFRCEAITDLNELTTHLLEVISTPLNLKKLRAKESMKSVGGGALYNTFENSMISGGIGGGTGIGMPAGGPMIGFSPNQSLVLRVISGAPTEIGLHRDQIIAAVKNQIRLGEIMAILEFLSGEGHVYCTIDDNHYKVTAC